MSSLFEFSSTSGFRKRLLTRNLTPYAKAPNRPTLPIDTPYVQTDSSVQDSPDQLIDDPTFANLLYPLNQFGADGGYRQVPDPTGLLNTKSNEGEYGPGQQDAKILAQSQIAAQRGFDAVSPAWKPLNAYANGTQTSLDSGEYITEPDFIIGGTRLYNNQPYPTTFNPSSYSPASILLSRDPIGSNGLLSQDSFIARLGAQTLRQQFEERIATQIRQQTIDRANIFNADSGADLLGIFTGRVPLIEPNWTITVPTNPVLAAADFALRLAGSIIPISPIPGSYFDPSINPGQPTTIGQLANAFRRSAVGNFFNRLLGATQTGSQLFLNNTGAGQRTRLFGSLNFNKYKPSYDRTIFDRLAGALVGTTENNSNYYIGSRSSEPAQVFSPAGALPVNEFGEVQQSPVFGPSELAQLYEGPSQDVRLGANGVTYSDGGGIEGGFTWVSPKYRGNAGKKVGFGGEVTDQDEDFRPSSYNSTESTNRVFREGSILDDTQRLIDSQPQGGKRLQHVGNAIDQVSKVFNDGYKELTKGSRVYRYEGAPGQEVGTEYCRVFAKDIPYLQYNDLQKVDGITTKGRRFSDSVFDNTYNLNIYPNKQEGGQSSTNLIGTNNEAFAKKYMFSLENLAWRTSSTPGFSTSDLAVCERGPNGGRVMWFPPYGLTFNETVSANWQQNDFLGRPEPIYTYKNTSRSGTLSWKIIVDHPSVLNVIVNKVLDKETNRERIDSILDSFFAGCLKYDLYELAKKYWKVNPNDLYVLQQAISSKQMTREQIEWTKSTIQTGVDGGQGQPLAQNSTTNVNLVDKYKQLSFYFGNNLPLPNLPVQNYKVEYDAYRKEKTVYELKPNKEQTSNFFTNVVEKNFEDSKNFINDLAQKLENNTSNAPITITINASCSAPASQSYNRQLAQRRIESVEKYFRGNEKLSKFIDKTLLIKQGQALGETTQVRKWNPSTNSFEMDATLNCSDANTNARGGDTSVQADEVYTINAMACRRAFIEVIEDKTSQPSSTPVPNYTDVFVGNTVTETVTTEEIVRQYEPRDNVTKRVLQSLLSECDYFEMIRAESPMLYDNLKDKLKFFQPAFHSMTPEGLNTRLTFLQQCMRPGDSIPTIKEVDGAPTLQYNNATNTAFGAPPVLVLRIGDFYNTKIIPNSLNFTFEELDINPEGIGIQPMIANVTLGFNFVGGSGLKESVDKLQNALTFNYYANTEIYDERADVTAQENFLKVLDQEFLSRATPPQPPAANQTQVNNGLNNNSTIGSILEKNITETGEEGVISYSEFVSRFVNETQTYFQNVVNKQKEITNQYNNAVRQQWMAERNYTEGITPITTEKIILFGKNSNLEKRFDAIFTQYVANVKANDDEFIKWINRNSANFSTRLKDTIKSNYVNFINNKRGSFPNAATTITQNFTNIQTQYIQFLSRMNVLSFNDISDAGTDGFQTSNGNTVVYKILGTPDVNPASKDVSNTYDELVKDYEIVINDITEFNDIVEKTNKFTENGNQYSGILVTQTANAPSVDSVFEPFSQNAKFDIESFKRQYMIVSDDVIDDKKYETFKQAIIGNTIGNQAILNGGNENVEEQFDKYWIGIAKPLFTEENKLTISFIDNVEKNELKKFMIYKPFETKDRKLTFTNENVSLNDNTKKAQQTMIQSLGALNNSVTETRGWNDLISGAYISKVKLN